MRIDAACDTARSGRRELTRPEPEESLDGGGHEADAGIVVTPRYESVGVEPIDHPEHLGRDGDGVVDPERACVHAVADDALEESRPGIHLRAHALGERFVAATERPRLHPHEGDIGTGAVEERAQQLAHQQHAAGTPLSQAIEVAQLGRDDRVKRTCHDVVHARGMMRDERRPDADRRRDGTQGHRAQSLLAGDALGGGGDLRAALFSAQPRSPCGIL